MPIGHPFRLFLFSVLYKLLDCCKAEDISSLIRAASGLIYSTVKSLVSIEGKTKNVDALLQDGKTDLVFQELVKASYSRNLDSQNQKEQFPRMNIFCLFMRHLIEKLPEIEQDSEKAEGSRFSLELFMFENLSIGSGRENKRRPYVTVFRVLLQQFLKLKFTDPNALLRFLSSVFSGSDSFDWLTTEDLVFDKIEVQVCALHVFKVCLETLNKSAEAALAFDSEGTVVFFFYPCGPKRMLIS